MRTKQEQNNFITQKEVLNEATSLLRKKLH